VVPGCRIMGGQSTNAFTHPLLLLEIAARRIRSRRHLGKAAFWSYPIRSTFHRDRRSTHPGCRWAAGRRADLSGPTFGANRRTVSPASSVPRGACSWFARGDCRFVMLCRASATRANYGSTPARRRSGDGGSLRRSVVRGSVADEPMTNRPADARRLGPDNLAGAPRSGGRSALGLPRRRLPDGPNALRMTLDLRQC
jgi:hypothetical protein